MQRRAYQLWQRDINAKGGLLGRPVEIVIIDDESRPARAVELYKQFIRDKRVDMVLGPYSSGITAAVAPIVDKASYPMVAGGASSDKIWKQGYKNIFGVNSAASRYCVGMLNLAVVHDLTTVAIIYADDAFSVSVGEGARKWGSKLGLKVVMFEKFEKGRRDLTELAEIAKAFKPALVIAVGHLNESVDMRRALKKVGWQPKAYYATIGPVQPAFREMLGTDAELTFSSTLWESKLKFSESLRFLAMFRALYKIEPSYQAAAAYAAGQVLEAAVNSAKSLKRNKIRQALSELEIYTILGRYRVDRTGMNIKHFPWTVQLQKGKKEIVWPLEAQTAEPAFK